MTLPPAGYLSDAARTESEMKTALEDQRNVIAELDGELAGLQAVRASGGILSTRPPAGSGGALPGLARLRGANNATTPATKFDLTFAQALLLNPTTGETILRVNAATFTCDVGVQGRNGRDQAAAFSANTWLNFFVTWDGVALATRVSTNAPDVGPTLANGETHWAFACTIRLGNTSQLYSMLVRERWCYYRLGQSMWSGNPVVGTEYSVSLAAWCPPTAASFAINVWGEARASTNTQAAAYDLYLYHVASGVPVSRARVGLTGASDANAKMDGLNAYSLTLPYTGYLSFAWAVSIAITAGTLSLYTQVDGLGYEN